MEINNIGKNLGGGAINAYKKTAMNKPERESSAKARAADNTDKIDFSARDAINARAANIADELRTEASAERLEYLKAAYSGDSTTADAQTTASFMFYA
jgi:anti-sigma28 factor (negative regulator of flagellin synthesis)